MNTGRVLLHALQRETRLVSTFTRSVLWSESWRQLKNPADSRAVVLWWLMSSRDCPVVLRRDAVASRRRPPVSGGGAARRRASSSGDAGVSRGSFVAAAPPAGALARGRAAADLRTRHRTGWGPRLIAGETGHAHATVWRALRREGISRIPRQPRDKPRRYEWPCPGDLLHIDSKRFVRFSRPGHAVTGDRRRTGGERRMRVGYEWVHSIVDDHSR